MSPSSTDPAHNVSLTKADKELPELQAGLRKRFQDLATLRAVKIFNSDDSKDSYSSSTIVPADGPIELSAIEGEPYRHRVQANSVNAYVYTALASHVVTAGIVGGQIRTCPVCDRIFIMKLKPQPKRQFHCSIQCTNRATFRRYELKRKDAALALARKQIKASTKRLPAAVRDVTRKKLP